MKGISRSRVKCRLPFFLLVLSGGEEEFLVFSDNVCVRAPHENSASLGRSSYPFRLAAAKRSAGLRFFLSFCAAVYDCIRCGRPMYGEVNRRLRLRRGP